jgi:DDE superfamily endonuclease
MSSVSYRDLELMLLDRGVEVDHTTIFRWIQVYAPEIEKRIRPHLRPCNGFWRMDETYIKVKGRWSYLHRAIDSRGQTIDFLLQPNAMQPRPSGSSARPWARCTRSIRDFVARRLGSAHWRRLEIHQVTRTQAACPRSRIRSRDLTAIATSVTRRASSLDFKVSPMTRL